MSAAVAFCRDTGHDMTLPCFTIEPRRVDSFPRDGVTVLRVFIGSTGPVVEVSEDDEHD